MSVPSLLNGVFAPAPRYMMRLALVEKLLQKLPDSCSSFLEIGPGMGDLSLYLSQRFPNATGDLYEISEESIAFLKSRIPPAMPLSTYHADFLALDAHDFYDLAIACEVFEHLEDDTRAFRKIYQLLKKGGYFLFSAPAGMEKWGPADQYGGHVRRYERNELEEKFHIEGFTILHLWMYGFPITHLTNPLSNKYYARMNAQKKLSQAESTKRSGTERTVARWLRRLPVATLMIPFFACQNRVKETEHGDGYLVLARK